MEAVLLNQFRSYRALQIEKIFFNRQYLEIRWI